MKKEFHLLRGHDQVPPRLGAREGSLPSVKRGESGLGMLGSRTRLQSRPPEGVLKDGGGGVVREGRRVAGTGQGVAPRVTHS